MSGTQDGGTHRRDDVGSELKREAGEAAAKAREKFDESAERLGEQAASFGEEQKRMSAKQVRGIAEAAHTAARELEGRMPMAASLVHSTADRLDGAAVALRERSIGQLLDDIGEFARREPVLFFGGAMVAGFALSRFLKSSAADLPMDTDRGERGANNSDSRAHDSMRNGAQEMRHGA